MPATSPARVRACPRTLTDLELLRRLAGLAPSAAARLYGDEPDLGALSRTHAFARAGARASERTELAFELARRMHAVWGAPKTSLGAPHAVAAWAMRRLSEVPHEELWVLGINARQELIGAECVGRGGLHHVSVCLPEILRAAIRFGASQFLLVHNHPSGDPTPSAEDIELTLRVQRASLEVSTVLLDHVIIAGVSFVSLFDSGYLHMPDELGSQRRGAAPP